MGWLFETVNRQAWESGHCLSTYCVYGPILSAEVEKMPRGQIPMFPPVKTRGRAELQEKRRETDSDVCTLIHKLLLSVWGESPEAQGWLASRPLPRCWS